MSDHGSRKVESEYRRMLVGGTVRSGPLPRHSQTGGFGAAVIPMLMRFLPGVIGGIASAIAPKRGRGSTGSGAPVPKRAKKWRVERNPFDEVVY